MENDGVFGGRRRSLREERKKRNAGKKCKGGAERECEFSFHDGGDDTTARRDVLRASEKRRSEFFEKVGDPLAGGLCVIDGDFGGFVGALTDGFCGIGSVPADDMESFLRAV